MRAHSLANASHRVLGVGVVLAIAASAAYAANLSGAIFTTTVDGSVVNENTRYDAKTDVYLDGGPGPHAPASAAGLPEGNYYFQVTDPSGQDLLSSDAVDCRRVHVSAAGVIDTVYPGTTYVKVKGVYAAAACQHASGIDIDHGATTVQLFPYDDTPNPGGVYKVWLTPTSSYTGSTASCVGLKVCNVNGEAYAPGGYHGFVPSQTKTDNYKVRVPGKVFTAPLLTVSKFHDANMNAIQDASEETVTGWAVDVTDTTGVSNTLFTTASYLANAAGIYTFVESTPAGTQQTAAYKDGVAQAVSPTVNVTVANTSGETHSVVYGNVGLGSFDACKVFDRNGNGVQDAGEGFVAGWQFTLTGTNILGAAVGPSTGTADASGCTSWDNLAPGSYTVTEGTETSGEWTATSATSVTGTIISTLSGASMAGGSLLADFHNQRWLVADFGTKGYWHNVNGLAELTQANIDEVNPLDPYRAPSVYWNGGDEPFDGYFSDGTPVPAAEGNIGSIAVAGSFQAEVSDFLSDANTGGTHEEQLAQQLLAFIFNVQHRLDSGDAYLELSDGSLISANDLIGEAIAAWNTGTDAEVVAIQELLESYNSGDAIGFVPASPGTPSF